MTSEELLAPISETEALRQQLLQAQRLSSVGELASSIAHEFNNILTTIINSAKLGSRNPDLGDKQQAFDRIVKAGQRAAAIAAGMLGFARKSASHRQHCDIARLVEEVLTLTDKDLSKNRVHVEMKFHARPVAWVVPGQIEQILVNLVINARQAMSEGGHQDRGAREPRRRYGGNSRLRHGAGHPTGPTAAHLRAVLHHQTARRVRARRHGVGPERVPADHRTAPRPHSRLERRREGFDVHRHAPEAPERRSGVRATCHEDRRREAAR